MSFAIRKFQDGDLPALVEFFRKCYGPETIFQDPTFIRWYLAGAIDGGLESLVAVNDRGEVVAHYGGLPCTLQLHNRRVSMVWGVNAYTLPDWRSKGIGQRLVELMMDRYDVFGVIGFTPKSADFYQTAGFNVFGKQRFHRFALALRESAHEVAMLIGVELAVARERFPIRAVHPLREAQAGGGTRVVPIGRAMDAAFSWERLAARPPAPAPADSPLRQTASLPHTHAAPVRDFGFLRRRFFAHPFLRYEGFAVVAGNQVTGYAITRREQLLPTEHHALRIIDLRMEPDLAGALLSAVIEKGVSEQASFIDFSCAGAPYDEAFSALSFAALHDDEVAMLPQVTAPIEARPNQEFLGLFSRRYANEVAALSSEDIYFTRADSDRDRIAKLSQRVA